MAWLYVPDMGDSSWELNESFLQLEPFVMWRGKPMRPPTLSKRWRKGGFITRLYGMTLEPSTANLGVERWISSLEVSHVSPSQVLENNWGTKTPDTYGLSLNGSLAKCDQDSYSLRTSQVSLDGSFLQFSSTLPNWGIMLHGVLWRLPKWARPTEGKDGSCLPSVPTPSTQGNVSIRGQYDKNTGTTLGGYARMFPTPTVAHLRNHNEPIESYLKRVNDYKEGKTKGKPGISLGVHARMFPTPTTGEEKYRLQGNTQASKCLAAMARKGELTDGEEVLTHGGKLNPEWVAWLMGLPIGWIN